MGVCLSVAVKAAKALEKKQKREERQQQQQQQQRPHGSYAAAAGGSSAASSSSSAGAYSHAPAALSSPPPSSSSLSPGASRAVFFPDPAMPCRYGSSCRRGNCQYAHGPTSLMALLEEIGRARSTLDICVFTITCNEIATAIKDAKSRGVRVRLITDDDQAEAAGSDIQSLVNSGIPARHDNNHEAHMHHKFAVIDDRTLLNGSFNWTRSAVLKNRENVVISTDAVLVRQFANEFDNMWNLFSANHVRISRI